MQRASNMWAAVAITILASSLLPTHGLTYQRTESLMGPDFFNHWNFYTGPDPTHGTVKFVDENTAWRDRLISASDNRVVMRADNTTVLPKSEGRKALRIESKNRYNDGLFVMKLDHIPTACGSWPAFWMFGDDAQHSWPRWGEFDIWETIHMDNFATTTLHTRNNCDQRAVNEGIDFQGQGWAVGTESNKAKNCWVHADAEYDNQGCGQKLQDGSAGPKFNQQGGGTFIAEWDPVVNKRLRTWFFPAGEEPEIGENPNPDLWGIPNSFFTLHEKWCTAEHFHNMKMVFDVTFCGDYAGGTFHASCPSTPMSCEDYVRSKPNAFSETFWSIKRLDVYKSAKVDAQGLDHQRPVWLGFAAFFVLTALGGLMLYYYCSHQRIVAIQQALTAPQKDGKLVLPIAQGQRKGGLSNGKSLATSPNARREVFIAPGDTRESTAPEVERTPAGFSFRRMWLMFCCANDPTPSEVAGTRPLGYDEVHPTSPSRTPTRTGEITPMRQQPSLRKDGSGRVGSGILVRASSGALVDKETGKVVVAPP